MMITTMMTIMMTAKRASDQEDTDNQIAREIKQDEAHATERRMTLLSTVGADELDPWLRDTGCNEVLSMSKHNIIQTHYFTPELESLWPLRVVGMYIVSCLIRVIPQRDSLGVNAGYS
jgi:hypothetical protein